ncbi:capsule polysaccharide transporter [Francisella noatunensis]|uniref:Capsule polysaccharide transporter n=1 Tax=Francisella noatunensis TaxID=657445 RepID=A0A9Q2KTM4_9GAMM|nr:capsule polysaccharide transporter [Francisella noatunensis]MBK2028508.1 capsule polysaccharide transporter [Francisella noatunensis]MBK2034131.1 capsule polysaccharide transporter [Francisella noatunensis]MBK2048858.1 capsule polysaccharide transporter [Francisella noatunensis]MBK2050378.1 capsule polysaccharide transporter [Francisella noatunensis]MBK2051682.1 capsule polysaccharide transporter [Francisella noatunensis]
MLYRYRYYINNFLQLFYKRKFAGWGRKKTGRLALWCHAKFGGTVRLYEDGFIRSLGLGVDGSPAFSVVVDDIGIYYDATMPSRLENILNSYDFVADNGLLATAREAMMLIRKYNVSKYNNAPEVDEKFCQKYNLYKSKKNILIIAQTAGDSSLEYGLANHYSTDDMLEAAILENPLAKIYLKIHPDVFTGKKQSDIDIANIPENIAVITENINPVSLLKHFDKVYTKTSGMGFEALLSGCECVCFGMPYYAGWGITDDRVKCDRRVRKLSIEEVFAAAYILYSRYYNPYKKRQSNIIDTITEIVKRR